MAPELVADLIHFWGQLGSGLGLRQGASRRVAERDMGHDFCFLRQHFSAVFVVIVTGLLCYKCADL